MYKVNYVVSGKTIESLPATYPKPLALYLAKQKNSHTTYGKWCIKPI